jgi:hypothetical protein
MLPRRHGAFHSAKYERNSASGDGFYGFSLADHVLEFDKFWRKKHRQADLRRAVYAARTIGSKVIFFQMARRRGISLTLKRGQSLTKVSA